MKKNVYIAPMEGDNPVFAYGTLEEKIGGIYAIEYKTIGGKKPVTMRLEKERFEELRNDGRIFFENEVKFVEVPSETLEREIEKLVEKTRKESEDWFEREVKPLLGTKAKGNADVATLTFELTNRYYDYVRRYIPVAEAYAEDVADPATLREIAERLEDFEKNGLDGMIVNGDIVMDYRGECSSDYRDSVDMEEVLWLVNVLKPGSLNEKRLRRNVVRTVLKKLVSPVAEEDCQAVEDYIEGVLTFKGLRKKIDPAMIVASSC